MRPAGHVHVHADWRSGSTRRLAADWVSELVSWVAAGYCVYAAIAAVSTLRWVPESPFERGLLAALTLLIGCPSLVAHIGKNSGFD